MTEQPAMSSTQLLAEAMREARKQRAFARMHARRAKDLLDAGSDDGQVQLHALVSLALSMAYNPTAMAIPYKEEHTDE